MKSVYRFVILATLSAVALLLSACSIDIVRNDDGTLTATVTMREAELQKEIELALEENEGPIQSMTVDLQDGFATVTAVRLNEDTGETKTIAFKLELAAADGKLDATASGITLDGEPLDAERAEKLAKAIEKRLENSRWGKAKGGRTLESVTISEDQIEMVWHIDRKDD